MDAEREQFSAQLEKNISPNNSELGGQHSKKSSYFCSHCDFPSDMIGLLDPCAHVFCLSCASQMSTCAICRDEVAKVRIVKDMSQVFVSPLTLQGFSSMRELQEHLRRFRS
ncbi:hypothetical protein M9435_000831 [Picochlorum sp. BPE23]|nr:hypothetical protein M9435_000831 [Picochlorum sp. BPE23]